MIQERAFGAGVGVGYGMSFKGSHLKILFYTADLFRAYPLYLCGKGKGNLCNYRLKNLKWKNFACHAASSYSPASADVLARPPATRSPISP